MAVVVVVGGVAADAARRARGALPVAIGPGPGGRRPRTRAAGGGGDGAEAEASGEDPPRSGRSHRRCGRRRRRRGRRRHRRFDVTHHLRRRRRRWRCRRRRRRRRRRSPLRPPLATAIASADRLHRHRRASVRMCHYSFLAPSFFFPSSFVYLLSPPPSLARLAEITASSSSWAAVGGRGRRVVVMGTGIVLSTAPWTDCPEFTWMVWYHTI